MGQIQEKQATVIRTSRGLAIAGTRKTLYQIMDYIKADHSKEVICKHFKLTIEQIEDVFSYIESHRNEVEAEYREVLAYAAENRQYWEARNRERLTEIGKGPPKPGQEQAWLKLQERKARLQQS